MFYRRNCYYFNLLSYCLSIHLLGVWFIMWKSLNVQFLLKFYFLSFIKLEVYTFMLYNFKQPMVISSLITFKKSWYTVIIVSSFQRLLESKIRFFDVFLSFSMFFVRLLSFFFLVSLLVVLSFFFWLSHLDTLVFYQEPLIL